MKRSNTLPGIALALMCAAVVMTAHQACAEDFWMIFQQHKVTIVARDVPVSKILDRWSQVGGTVVVNADAIQSGPVSLQLVDVPERDALEILLRGVNGYIVADREDGRDAGSTIGRILILRKSTGPVRNQPMGGAAVVAAIEEPSVAEPVPDESAASASLGVPVAERPARAGASMTTGASGPVAPAFILPRSVDAPGTVRVGEGTAQPMLYRAGSGATSQPGQAPAMQPVTRLSSGPHVQQQ